jgi:hypothetical protein
MILFGMRRGLGDDSADPVDLSSGVSPVVPAAMPTPGVSTPMVSPLGLPIVSVDPGLLAFGGLIALVAVYRLGSGSRDRQKKSLKKRLRRLER